MIRAMVGRDLTEMYPKSATEDRPAGAGAQVAIRSPSPAAEPRRPLVRDVDLAVRMRARSSALFGLLGSGARSRLHARCLARIGVP